MTEAKAFRVDYYSLTWFGPDKEPKRDRPMFHSKQYSKRSLAKAKAFALKLAATEGVKAVDLRPVEVQDSGMGFAIGHCGPKVIIDQTTGQPVTKETVAKRFGGM